MAYLSTRTGAEVDASLDLADTAVQLAGESGGQTIIGGTGVTDKLVLQGTSGNGTSTAAALEVNVGNNGGTNAITLLNNGKISIGVTSPIFENSYSVYSIVAENGATRINNELFIGPKYKFYGSGNNMVFRDEGAGVNLITFVSNSYIQFTPAAFVEIKVTTEQLRLGYDASNYASFTVDSAGNLTIAETGTNPSVYTATLRFGVKVTPVTTTASPAATDTGTVYNNIGDSDGATITLPSCAAGLQFTACVMVAQTLTVTAGSGDKIRIASSVTAAAGSITSNVIGSSVTLIGQDGETWLATSSVGSWSF